MELRINLYYPLDTQVMFTWKSLVDVACRRSISFQSLSAYRSRPDSVANYFFFQIEGHPKYKFNLKFQVYMAIRVRIRPAAAMQHLTALNLPK